MGGRRSRGITGTGFAAGWVATIGAIVCAGCAVQQTRRISRTSIPPPPVETSASDLAARLQNQRQAVQTMTATVDLEPTTGSVYSGVIKQYHDVRAFILLSAPDHIRMLGQAPVVRTTIFDMASDGKEFKVLIPSKGKLIIGSTQATQPAKNSLESLRPQHILDALLVPAVVSGERYFMNQEEQGGRIEDVLNIVVAGADDQLVLKQRVWFDAATLEISQVDLYDPRGTLVEGVRYQNYEDYNGVHYPSHFELTRPLEDYALGVTIEKAVFNQPIPAAKFILEKPPNVELIQLSQDASRETRVGQ